MTIRCMMDYSKSLIQGRITTKANHFNDCLVHEPNAYIFQVFSMDLHVAQDDIKTFRGRVQASHEKLNNDKDYGASKQSLATVMKTRVSNAGASTLFQ